MESISGLIETVGQFIDVFGVAIIVLGVAWASVRFVMHTLGQRDHDASYQRFRKNIGKTLLIGLEILVAADIIRTVAVTPTLENVITLAIIVLIRTFLSWSLEVEISGRMPWNRAKETSEIHPE